MKKIFTLAALAVAALSASAQYTTSDPYLKPIADNADNQYFDVILLDAASVAKLEDMGKTVQALGPDGATRNLWYWDETLTGGDGTYPGIGWDSEQYDGYTSCTVTDKGWSGAGFNIAAPGVDFSHMSGDTRFHVCYRTEGTAPASVALILMDGTGSAPVKFAFGDNFDDNGNIFPSVAPKAGEEWQTIDIDFASLKKLYPAFDYSASAVKGWEGNVMAWLAGGVTGTSVSFDAMYFYSPKSGEGSVEGVAVEENAETTVYNLAGVKMGASTEGLAKGVYVVKSGAKASKVLVK